MVDKFFSRGVLVDREVVVHFVGNDRAVDPAEGERYG